MTQMSIINGIKFILVCICLSMGACSDHHDHHSEHDHEEATETIEKGIHNGRLLHSGNFTLELAIFETGVPPEYRAWAYLDQKPIKIDDVKLIVKLTRLGNKIDSIQFIPQGDFLRGDSVIYEPHSFSVAIEATYQGKIHQWQYDSFEGRTKIESAVAEALEIKTEIAGAATLQETIEVFGKVTAIPELDAAVKARFPGQVLAVDVAMGDVVKKGQVLMSIESNESLKPYKIVAPISGVVSELSARVGMQTDNKTLLRILDNSRVNVELAVFPEQREKIKMGAVVSVFYQDEIIKGKVDYITPLLNSNQSTDVRAKLDSVLPIGAHLKAAIQIDEYEVPLAVKRSGLQSFRDFTVVYAQIGDEYEVRMLELGREAGDWVEVLGGLEAGTTYVTENSFVIKADIEKSGASHDH
jgi:membrane fusion protein, heavy metal efflux system